MRQTTKHATHRLQRVFILFSMISFYLIGLMLPAPASAHDYKHGTIVIAHPFIRVDAKCDGNTTRAYIVLLANKGAQADKLTAVTLQGGHKGKLLALPATAATPGLSAIDLPAKSDTALMPPKHVIEFALPSKDLQVGGAIAATLQFERAGKAAINFMIESAPTGQACGSAPAAPTPAASPHQGHHGHHSGKH